MVEYHDKVIGRLLRYLENQGLQEDTLVVYLGDNGSPADVCSMMHQHNEICGGKGKTSDRGTHVPLICLMPGTILPRLCRRTLLKLQIFYQLFSKRLA